MLLDIRAAFDSADRAAGICRNLAAFCHLYLAVDSLDTFAPEIDNGTFD